uniref:NEDD8-conjugating enzyme UBC12 n=15 Tax=Aves TaxID=8782 RepID=A0A672U6B8_STRHB
MRGGTHRSRLLSGRTRSGSGKSRSCSGRHSAALGALHRRTGRRASDPHLFRKEPKALRKEPKLLGKAFSSIRELSGETRGGAERVGPVPLPERAEAITERADAARASARSFPKRPKAGGWREGHASDPPPFRKNPKRLRKEPKARPERAEGSPPERAEASEGRPRNESFFFRKNPKRVQRPPEPSPKSPEGLRSPFPLFRRAPKPLPENPEALPEVAERRRQWPIPFPSSPQGRRRRRFPRSGSRCRRRPPRPPLRGGAPPGSRPPPGPGPGPGSARPGRMIKLFSLKQQKKEEESAGGTKGTSKKASAAQLRIQKDINELNLPKTCEIDFSDQDDLLHFRLLICPDEGFYKGGKFVFSFKVGQGYPHDPPKVKCETMVYHPNIDLEGNVCLNILREDWKPVLTINSIIYGLQYLFLEPNPEDPLNKEAAEVLQSNRRLFEQNVQRSLRGGYVGATYFERCLK